MPITDLVARADFEVFPMKGILERVSKIDPGSAVTVTASPAQGIDTTVDLALEIQGMGYEAVPHLSSRLIENRSKLESIVARLKDGGIGRVFVVGGDGDLAGEFEDALAVLVALGEIGHSFREVGITGYPEGHPSISDARLRQALLDKQAHATYIATQMCFDPKAIGNWLRSIRSDSVILPVRVGVPGVVDRARLVSIGARIGVGDSMKYLAKNRKSVFQLLRGSYTLDNLVAELASLGSELGVIGLHIFTFNQVAETVEWFKDVSPLGGTGR